MNERSPKAGPTAHWHHIGCMLASLFNMGAGQVVSSLVELGQRLQMQCCFL